MVFARVFWVSEFAPDLLQQKPPENLCEHVDMHCRGGTVALAVSQFDVAEEETGYPCGTLHLPNPKIKKPAIRRVFQVPENQNWYFKPTDTVLML